MFDQYLRGLLFDQAGEGEGGGGTGTGTGQGEGEKPVFDPAKFQADLMKSVTDTINAAINGFDKKIEAKLKTTAKSGEGDGKQGTGTGTDPGKQKEAVKDPFADERTKEYEERMRRLEERAQKAEQAALDKDRDVEIQTAMGKFQWAPEADKEVVFDYYQSKAVRNDAGELVIKKGGEEYPLAKYISEHIPRAFKGELAARNVGGSGADARGKAGSKAVADLDAINSKMTPETDAAVRAAIGAAIAATRG